MSKQVKELVRGGLLGTGMMLLFTIVFHLFAYFLLFFNEWQIDAGFFRNLGWAAALGCALPLFHICLIPWLKWQKIEISNDRLAFVCCMAGLGLVIGIGFMMRDPVVYEEEVVAEIFGLNVSAGIIMGLLIGFFGGLFKGIKMGGLWSLWGGFNYCYAVSWITAMMSLSIHNCFIAVFGGLAGVIGGTAVSITAVATLKLLAWTARRMSKAVFSSAE